MTDSRQLLRDYAGHRDERAFNELVARHADLVYSTALRRVGGDAHLAQDVTQTVFADLARKAKTLAEGVILSGWLYRHTCFTAAKALRTERRRQIRERQAVIMNELNDDTLANWRQLASLPESVRSQYSSAEQMMAALAMNTTPIAGMRILSQTEQGPDDTILHTQWQYDDGRIRENDIRFHRYDDGWRQVVPDGLVDKLGHMVTDQTASAAPSASKSPGGK